MKKRSIIIWSCLMLMIASAHGQEEPNRARDDNLSQVRLIKVNRMSEAWKGSPVELRLFNGNKEFGTFLAIENSSFKLNRDAKVHQTNVFDVKELVIKRQSEDLVLVSLVSLGAAALFVAGTSLGIESSSGSRPNISTLAGAAVVGASVGFTIGWQSFYQDIVVSLE